MPQTCPHCSAKLPHSVARFCPHCGAAIDARAESAPASPVGQVLDGTYRVDALLATGGMGRVYRGRHLGLDRPVAIKMLHPGAVKAEEAARRLMREARAAARFEHPSAANVYQLGRSESGEYYIVMELVEGPTLRELIERSAPLPVERAVRLCRQLLGALSEAHRAFVLHRDLKPANIIVTAAHTPKGPVERLKLVDFGLARIDTPDESVLTLAGASLGTPHYTAPEQTSGESVDPRADLYAVGAILYEMLTGEPVFADSSPVQVALKHLGEQPIAPTQRRPELRIPPAVEAVCLRALQKSPERRFSSAEHMLSALETAMLAEARKPPARASRPGVPVWVSAEGVRDVKLLVRDFGPRALFMVAPPGTPLLPLFHHARVRFGADLAKRTVVPGRVVYATKVREPEGLLVGYGLELTPQDPSTEAAVDAHLAPVRRSSRQSITPRPAGEKG